MSVFTAVAFLIPVLIPMIFVICIYAGTKRTFGQRGGSYQRQNRPRYRQRSTASAGRRGQNGFSTAQRKTSSQSSSKPASNWAPSKSPLMGKSFSNSGFDKYPSFSGGKSTAKYTTGYDKNYSRGGTNYRKSANMQYSHTFDGHEPWDKCLPKEKDPWDKDFMA